MSVAALRRCVGDVDSFFEKYWAAAPLLLRAEDSNFDDLASFADLDRMLSSLGLRESNLRMVKDGQTLPVAAYTTPPSGRSRGSERSVSGAMVYERYADGATIVLESLHRYWEPLTDFSRDLELALGHKLQVNAYITPPGSRGFAAHRDEHDVFVLQVWGAKHWTVLDRDEDGSVIIDETLERGASLYIPSGFPHSARTGGAASAHLTVGILTHEGIDIIKEIAKLAEAEPTFHRRIDQAGTKDEASLKDTIEGVIADMRVWLDGLDTDRLARRVARRVRSSSQPLVRGQLRQLELLEHLEGASTVARRRGATCFVLSDESGLSVLLADRELQMPLVAEDAMALVAERERFTVSELHSALDPEGSLVLVKRLVREGFLEVVFDD